MQDKIPYNEQGNLHGIVKLYWSDGNIMSEQNYANGVRLGYCVHYDAINNLKLRIKTYYAR